MQILACKLASSSVLDWLSDDTLVTLNLVALRQTRLVLWAGKPSQHETSRPGQLSMAIHMWVIATSTRENCETDCAIFMVLQAGI